MSTTTPAYALRDDCPTWCTRHEWDTLPGREPVFRCHAEQMGEGDDELDLFLSSDGQLGAADMGNVERTPSSYARSRLTSSRQPPSSSARNESPAASAMASERRSLRPPREWSPLIAPLEN
jgi:hypothetical protein